MSNLNVPGETAYLSKSLFVRGVRCHKSLYLQKYRPELKDLVSESLQAKFETGYQVGDLACRLFPGGVPVPYEGLSHTQQIEMTAQLIAKGCKTIYEATFFSDGIFIKADILHLSRHGWDVYEVKAATSVKDYHIGDVAVQHHVIRGAGLPVGRAFLVHVNNQYVRQGEIDVKGLFVKANITDAVEEKQAFVAKEIRRQRAMLKGPEPIIDIGPHCSDPYECDFAGHCWSHLPTPSVFDLRDKGRPNLFELYRQGIVRLEDIPADTLGWRQQLQMDGYLHQKNHIDKKAVRAFIKSLWYPLCFMDFETYYTAPVPLYDGTRPYQQVPFQFSLHIQDKPGGEIRHVEYLADGATDPRPGFLKNLLAAVPKKSCVVVWNQSFEIGRLRELARDFPRYAAKIEALIENIRDLMAPFRDKSIYHWKFDGQYSIKAVLPALIDGAFYESLAIGDGGVAASEWLRMISMDDPAEKEQIRKNLLEYCKLDTYAEVLILEKMREMIGP